MTPLDKTLKRALKIGSEDFVLTLTPGALKLTRKGHKRGVELVWESLVSGDAAMAIALQASVGQFQRAAVATKSAASAVPVRKPVKKVAERAATRRETKRRS